MLQRFTAAAIFACNLFAFSSAKADSYTFTPVGNANNETFVSGNDYGDYVLRVDPNKNPGCNQQASACFATHIAATGAVSYSATIPTLAVAPNPVAGTGCTFTGFALVNTCVNDRQFISGFTGPNGYTNALYEVFGQNYVGVTSGPGAVEYVSPNGNLFYANEFQEILYVGINTDTIPSSVTPEPSSFALLGTGILGVIGAARRRFVA